MNESVKPGDLFFFGGAAVFVVSARDNTDASRAIRYGQTHVCTTMVGDDWLDDHLIGFAPGHFRAYRRATFP